MYTTTCICQNTVHVVGIFRVYFYTRHYVSRVESRIKRQFLYFLFGQGLEFTAFIPDYSGFTLGHCVKYEMSVKTSNPGICQQRYRIVLIRSTPLNKHAPLYSAELQVLFQNKNVAHTQLYTQDEPHFRLFRSILYIQKCIARNFSCYFHILHCR